MFIPLIRTVILYIFIAGSLRILGKRQIGQMEPSELVVTILISELAAIPMQDLEIPMMNGIIPILTLILIEMGISILLLRSRKMRYYLSGKPEIVVADGKIIESALKHSRVTLDELFKELRLKDIHDISTLKYAIIETNGQISVLKKYGDETPTRDDLNVAGEDGGLYRAIISDGIVNSENLKECGKSMEWLQNYLGEKSLNSPDEVFYLGLNESGKLILQVANGKYSADNAMKGKNK